MTKPERLPTGSESALRILLAAANARIAELERDRNNFQKACDSLWDQLGAANARAEAAEELASRFEQCCRECGQDTLEKALTAERAETARLGEYLKRSKSVTAAEIAELESFIAAQPATSQDACVRLGIDIAAWAADIRQRVAVAIAAQPAPAQIAGRFGYVHDLGTESISAEPAPAQSQMTEDEYYNYPPAPEPSTLQRISAIVEPNWPSFERQAIGDIRQILAEARAKGEL